MCDDDAGASCGRVGARGRKERAFDAVVDDEEGCRGGGGAEQHRRETRVDAADGLS